MDGHQLPDGQPPGLRKVYQMGRLPIDRHQAMVTLIFSAILLTSLLLPHAGDMSGWDVLLRSQGADNPIQIRSSMFAWSIVATSAAAALALLSRRWIFALSTAFGAVWTTLLGTFVAWTQQSFGGRSEAASGAGLGLFIGILASAALAYNLAVLVPASPVTPDRQSGSSDSP